MAPEEISAGYFKRGAKDSEKRAATRSNYAAKIAGLLRSCDEVGRQTGIADEQQGVALILLVNPNLVNDSEFQQLWAENHQQLLPFCRRLVLPSAAGNLALSYARLVALLLDRLLPLSHAEAFSIQELPPSTLSPGIFSEQQGLIIQLLLRFLSSTNDPGYHRLHLTVQVVGSLDAYLTELLLPDQALLTESVKLLDRTLDICWKLYVQEMVVVSAEKKLGAAVHTTETMDDGGGIALLGATLDAVLDRTDPNSQGVDNGESQDNAVNGLQRQLHRTMENLFRIHVVRSVEVSLGNDSNIATIWTWWEQSILELAPSNKAAGSTSTNNATSFGGGHGMCLPKDMHRSWVETLLSLTRSLASASSTLSERLGRNPALGSALTRLILFHVAAPDDKSESVRFLAWTACATLVSHLKDFGWMSCPPNDEIRSRLSQISGPLGSASNFCTLLRLASGEWRIQLGYRLMVRENAGKDIPLAVADTVQQQQRVGIAEACAQVIACVVTYLAQFADDIEKGRDRNYATMSPEALLHLRNSMEDSFQAAANYLVQLNNNDHPLCPSTEDSVVVQLLGSLMTEFDVFDGHRNLNTDAILSALAMATKICQETKCYNQIVAGLATTFESAHGDAYRVELLKNNDLLGRSMHDFFRRYWEYVTDNGSGGSILATLPSIPWACHATEVWFSILDAIPKMQQDLIGTSCVENSIILWIKCVLNEATASLLTDDQIREFSLALNSGVGCYVTLHGDTPPTDQQVEIIQQATHFCSKHHRSSWR